MASAEDWTTMRRFIRLHPWRLEIVPAIAFATSVAALLLYRLRGSSALSSAGGDAGHKANLMFWEPVVFVACFWAMEFATNHRWVMSEREKRFNWFALVAQSVMVLRAAIALQMALWFAAEPTGLGLTWRVFCGVSLGSITLAVLIEATREFVPRPEEPEPPLSGERDSCSYTDTEVDYGVTPLVAFLVACSVLAILYERHYAAFALGLAVAAVIGSMAYRRVTITREAVLLRCGPIGKRFAVSEISGCRATHRQILERSQPPVKALALTTGRCLEITASDRRVHAIGMLRPTHACHMLEAFLAENRERPT